MEVRERMGMHVLAPYLRVMKNFLGTVGVYVCSTRSSRPLQLKRKVDVVNLMRQFVCKAFYGGLCDEG